MTDRRGNRASAIPGDYARTALPLAQRPGCRGPHRRLGRKRRWLRRIDRPAPTNASINREYFRQVLEECGLKGKTSLLTTRNEAVEGIAYDDLLGLIRGFLYAGARSLLLSLWSVNDASTTALMAEFYKEWQHGANKTKALQSAIQTVRQVFPHPFYWAPFILAGKV